eukprot:3370457-Pyramimonas_sp.AAC.1
MALWRVRGSRVQARPPQPYHSRGKDTPDSGGSPRARRRRTCSPVRVKGSSCTRRPRQLCTAKHPQVEQHTLPFNADKEW